MKKPRARLGAFLVLLSIWATRGGCPCRFSRRGSLAFMEPAALSFRRAFAGEQKYQKAPIRPPGFFSEWIMGCGQGISPAAVETRPDRR